MGIFMGLEFEIRQKVDLELLSISLNLKDRIKKFRGLELNYFFLSISFNKNSAFFIFLSSNTIINMSIAQKIIPERLK